MKLNQLALGAITLFTLTINAGLSNSLIRIGYRSYLNTRGELQLVGAAAGSYKLWKKLQTPAMKNSPLWMQRSVGALGMLAAYHAYRQIPETRIFQGVKRGWSKLSAQNKRELDNINSFIDQTAYPASLLAKFGGAYFLATSFFGVPEQFLSEKTVSRAAAGIMVVAAEAIFRLGLMNYSMATSETLKPVYPTTTFNNLAQSAIPDVIRKTAADIRQGVWPENILLHGEPGHGKTTLIEALAGETGVPLFIVKMADIKRNGDSNAENNLAILFLTALSHAQRNPLGRAIIFVDELESIATDRKLKTAGTNSSLTGYFNSLMSLYQHSITVIGCTNVPEDIDGATIRPERLGEQVEILAPTATMREELFRVAIRDAHTRIKDRGINRRIHFNTIDAGALADITEGRSTAFIINTVHRAYRAAFTQKLTQIEHKFLEAIVREQLEKEDRFKKRASALSRQAKGKHDAAAELQG